MLGKVVRISPFDGGVEGGGERGVALEVHAVERLLDR